MNSNAAPTQARRRIDQACPDNARMRSHASPLRARCHRDPARFLAALVLCVLTLLATPLAPARAGGFDTPILYTARHLGMGGTAIGYVDDPSAVFHNPAGLQGVQGFAFVADFSLLLGKLQASPDVGPSARNVDSELTVAPFFLVGAAYRLHPWVSVGLAAFPVASGGAEYKYNNIADQAVEDKTRLLFLEFSPALSIDVPRDQWLPGWLSFGIGYRLDHVGFERQKGPPGNPALLDLNLAGFGHGVRAGVQWRPSPALSFGLVYRSKVSIDATADSGNALTQTFTDPELRFNLPTKFGLGARYDVGTLGFAADLEYGLYSENQIEPLRGKQDGATASVANAFVWSDAITARFGIEQRFGREQQWPVRIGYLFDGKVANPRFPNAFGTPPSPTHSLTLGAGVRLTPVRIDLAYVYRFGSTTLDPADVAPATECRFCGAPGDYKIGMHGLYLSVGGDLGK